MVLSSSGAEDQEWRVQGEPLPCFSLSPSLEISLLHCLAPGGGVRWSGGSASLDGSAAFLQATHPASRGRSTEDYSLLSRKPGLSSSQPHVQGPIPSTDRVTLTRWVDLGLDDVPCDMRAVGT